MLAGKQRARIMLISCFIMLCVITNLLFLAVSSAWAYNKTVISEDAEEFSDEITILAKVYIHPVPGVSIDPDHSAEGSPGEIMNYAHVVANKGNIPDTYDLTYTSSLGWQYTLFSDPNGDGNPSNGVELKDTNGNGIVDTGEIQKHCDLRIVKRTTIPHSAAIGAQDKMVITATSILDQSVTDSATNITTVIPPFEIFGGPTPVPPGVLPFTGAILLPFIYCAAMLLGAGVFAFGIDKVRIVRR